MNLKRILNLVAAVAAVAAAAGVCIVAAAMAVYALTLPWLGPAGAAAVVAAVFAVVAALIALVANMKAPPPKPAALKQDDAGLTDRLLTMAKERPIIALGAAAAAATILMRNPAMVTALVSAFLAGGSKPPK